MEFYCNYNNNVRNEYSNVLIFRHYMCMCVCVCVCIYMHCDAKNPYLGRRICIFFPPSIIILFKRNNYHDTDDLFLRMFSYISTFESPSVRQLMLVRWVVIPVCTCVPTIYNYRPFYTQYQ